MFQFRLSGYGLEEVQKLDRIIRAKVKEILHLPSWTSTEWTHSKDGLGLMEFQSMVVVAWKKASGKMLPNDVISQTIATQIDPINGE